MQFLNEITNPQNLAFPSAVPNTLPRKANGAAEFDNQREKN